MLSATRTSSTCVSRLAQTVQASSSSTSIAVR